MNTKYFNILQDELTNVLLYYFIHFYLLLYYIQCWVVHNANYSLHITETYLYTISSNVMLTSLYIFRSNTRVTTII